MSGFVARNRLILLAYAGVAVLLLITALFLPASAPSNLRSTGSGSLRRDRRIRPDLRHHRRRHRPVDPWVLNCQRCC